MTAHYVCRGTCSGESEKKGACMTPDCTDEGRALVKCECADGAHFVEEAPMGEESDELAAHDDADLGE